MGKPLLGAIPGIMVMVFIIEPVAWVALPVWLAISFGLSSSSNRFAGRGVGWELPVHRRTTNAVRNLAYLGWVLASAIVLTPLLFVLAGEPLDGGIAPAVLMLGGWGIVLFSLLATAGQFVTRGRLYIVVMSLLLVMPLMIIPSRGLTAILPDFLDPIIDGRYGLDSFSGRMLMKGQITAPAWDPGTWFISAAIWMTTALSMLYFVGSTHQE